MSRKTIITCLIGASVGLLGWSWASASPATVRGACDEAVSTHPSSSVVLARGRSLVAIGGGRTVRALDVDVAGVARHVAAVPARLAFVDDRAGADDLVIAIGDETIRLHEPSEVLHPSWSPSGELVWSLGDRLRLRRPSGTVRTIDPPALAGSVFSPTFDGAGSIVAVVEPRSAFGATEDDRANQLWRYDRSVGRWERLTHERMPPGRWQAIRTPVAAPDRTLEYVRVSGSDGATAPPRFELWRLEGGRTTLVRPLSSERYLAGYAGERRLWNVFDERLGGWIVELEGRDGRASIVGCGRVTVDPRTELDPDRAASHAIPAGPGWPPAPPTSAPSAPPTPTSTPTSAPAPTATVVPTPVPTPAPTGPVGSDPELPSGPAILVGDFATREQADATAATIAGASGAGSVVAVVDSSVAPAAIQPGVWGVVIPVAAGADPEMLLQAFRARFPDLAPWTWMVTV